MPASAPRLVVIMTLSSRPSPKPARAFDFNVRAERKLGTRRRARTPVSPVTKYFRPPTHTWAFSLEREEYRDPLVSSDYRRFARLRQPANPPRGKTFSQEDVARNSVDFFFHGSEYVVCFANFGSN